MPFNHNHHYHPLLLRQVPRGARTALEIGCGHGRFAGRLAAAGLAVDAVDASAEAIAAAAPADGVRYINADITTMDLPAAHYDVITCLAALHHVPFDTVSPLRQALRPGGMLAVLGLAHPSTPADLVRWGLIAPPVNLLARAIVSAGDRLNGGVHNGSRAPIRDAVDSMDEVRRKSAESLPGRRVRTLLFWRYLLTYRRPAHGHAAFDCPPSTT